MTDHKKLRNAMGQFPTGVAIVTTRDQRGSKVGLTINSFASVSLSPPLVSWSLSRSANTSNVFKQATHFAIHVLAAHQEYLSRRFAMKVPNKFEGVLLEDNSYGLPLMSEYVSRFVCKSYCKYYLGDHIIFTGIVEEHATQTIEPLVFLKGKYAKASYPNTIEPVEM